MADVDEAEERKLQEEIRETVESYAAANGYALHPDADVVAMVIKGLAKRQAKFGQAYCPCRVMSGDPEQDQAIICPCEFHQEEIERDGICHCRILVSTDYAENQTDR